MVKEFTDLQGIVGGLYAKAQGEPEEVWRAIYDHYKPLSMEDEIPSTHAGRILSLADKWDTLIECFNVGMAPTGSRDPFALRRAAQGVVRIIVEGKVNFDFPGTSDANCREFMRDRVEYYFRDVRGFAYDEVRACMAAGWSDLIDLEARLKRVQAIRPTPDFEPLAASFKRIKNILKQAQFTGGGALTRRPARSRPRARPLRRNPAHRRPAARIAHRRSAPQSGSLLRQGPGQRARRSVRRNRLALLHNLLRNSPTIADFSEIVTERQATHEKIRLRIRRRHSRRRWQNERRSRRQRRRPRRDEPRRRARASRLHHLHRSLQYLFPEQEQRSRKRSSRRSLRRSTKLEEQMGKKLGDPANPLLLSVRSGAKFSMPGMMNTILNLGLNDKTVEGLAKNSGNPRFAYDCYRRFIQMFGEVALDIDMHKFDHIFDERKKKAKVKLDTDLTADDLKAIIGDYKKLVQERNRQAVPAGCRASSSPCRATPCSVPGGARTRSPTAAWKRSRTKSAPPPTCKPWCSATWATLPAPASASRAIPPPAKRCSGASS